MALHLRKMLLSVATVVIACVATSVLTAATTGHTVIYTATGTFGATPISGADTLELAGEPFTIQLSANTDMEPTQHGQNWGVYTGLEMRGTVYSKLLGAVPTTIQSPQAGLQLTTGPNDIINAGFPVMVIGIQLNIKAHIFVPGGTLANPHILPFPTATIIPTGSTVTYSDTTAATVLSIASGTVVAAYPTGSVAELHPAGTQGDLMPLYRMPGIAPVLFLTRSSYFPGPDVV